MLRGNELCRRGVSEEMLEWSIVIAQLTSNDVFNVYVNVLKLKEISVWLGLSIGVQ